MSIPLPNGLDHGIPVPRTSLIGRDDDAVHVTDLLLSTNVSLVTVLGPGGVGKTRLALKVADELANSFRDGIWFVSLSSVQDPPLVAPTIAQALGMQEIGADSVLQRLHDRLRNTEMLLVLDNFEQVRDAALQLAELLRSCRDLKLLVTSRSVLQISSEHVYPISGLPVPASVQKSNPASLEEHDAVRLFVTRARTSDPRFRLSEHNAEAVVGICRQLDGLPLAIELAAARIRTLSPQALHARLSRRLTILGSRFQDVPERQRSIGDTVEWSVQLLAPEQRAVFRRISVFAGELSESAADAVAGTAVEGEQDLDVIEQLGSLVDQSLLQHVSSDTDVEPRFRMLQTIREVALEQLEESGELGETRNRHANHFLAVAEEAYPHLTGPEQVRWLNELERMLGDLRAALSWFEKMGRNEEWLRLAVALWRFGYIRGHLTEARGWLRSALAVNPEPSSLRALALNAEGLLANAQGDLDVAVACHEEAIALSRSIGDVRGIAAGFNGLGDAAAGVGDRPSAQEYFESAIELYRGLGVERGVAGALTNLGNLVWDARELERAVRYHEEALGHYQAVGDLRGMAWSMSNLGTLAVELGQYESGTSYLRDAIETYRQLVDPYGIMLALEGFAEIAHARGNVGVEATLFAAAQAIRERIGMPISASEQPRYHGVLKRIRQELGVSYDGVWAAGKAMSEDHVIRLVEDSEPDAVASRPTRSAAGQADRFGLTRREIEVLKLIAAGKTNKEISDELSISYRTVSTHVSNMLGKLDLTNRSSLASFAHREGVI